MKTHVHALEKLHYRTLVLPLKEDAGGIGRGFLVEKGGSVRQAEFVRQKEAGE